MRKAGELLRTTITFNEDLYESLTRRYRHLGFSRIGDLVNEAVREYLHRRQLEEKHRALERAAQDGEYRRVLKEVSRDFKYVDAEGLPDY